MFRKYAIFILLTALSLHLYGQERAGGGVGLVLSGGGAKGLYHIGVIEALEQNGVPIDCVAGTSMGSIVAGMYAAGYSPAEMRAFALSGEVERWLKGRIGAPHRRHYREQGRPPALVGLRFDVGRRGRLTPNDNAPDARDNHVVPATGKRKSLYLPIDMISSTQIDLGLAQLFAASSAGCGGDFDRMMVPFLCVASDMAGRRAVVFREGDVGEAIRASMSIPLIFKPLKKNKMLLYDGGLFDNFPWREMQRAFAPDHIIGVKCTEGNTPVDETSDLIDQTINLMTGTTDYNLPAEGNVMIDRAVDAGMLEFEKAEQIIRQGYDDTMARMEEILAAVGRHRVTPGQIAARREAYRAALPPLRTGEVDVAGVTDAQLRYAEAIGTRYTPSPQQLSRRGYFRRGDSVAVARTPVTFTDSLTRAGRSMSAFRAGLLDLMAEDDFDSGFPLLRYDSAGGVFRPQLQLHTRPQLRLFVSGNISSTAYNQARIGASYEHIGRVRLRANMEFLLGPIYNAGTVGGRLVFSPRLPVFFDAHAIFSVRNTLYGNFGNLTAVTNTMRKKHSEVFGSVAVGASLSPQMTLTATANGGENVYRFEQEARPTYFTFFGARLQLERSTLDNPLWPVRGTHLQASGIYVTGVDRHRIAIPSGGTTRVRLEQRDWLGAKLSWQHYLGFRRCHWFSLGYSVEGVWTNHPRFNDVKASWISLPQYAPTTHSQMTYMPEYHAAKYVAAGVIPTFTIVPDLFVRGGFYAMYRDREYSARQWNYIADLSLVYRTMLGPVSLSLTKYGLHNADNMYLSFNFGYLLFAPKGTFY